MIELILIGAGFAFAAAIQPGPLQAFLLSKVAQQGWRQTLPASFSPLLSDGPIAFLMLFILNNLSSSVQNILRGTGGVLLLYYAWIGYLHWRNKDTSTSIVHDSVPKTLFQAAAVNILNPNPYIGWGLVLGPAVLSAWRAAPIQGIALIASFYMTMVICLACTIIVFGVFGALSPKGHRLLLAVSTFVLAIIGLYQLYVVVAANQHIA